MLLDVASPSIIDDVLNEDILLILSGTIAIIVIVSVIIYIVRKNKKKEGKSNEKDI